MSCEALVAAAPPPPYTSMPEERVRRPMTVRAVKHKNQFKKAGMRRDATLDEVEDDDEGETVRQ